MSAVRSIGTAPVKFDLLVVGNMVHFALYNRIICSTPNRLVEGYGEQSFKVQTHEAERGNRRASIHRITPRFCLKIRGRAWIIRLGNEHNRATMRSSMDLLGVATGTFVYIISLLSQ
jgi:hypothetical protein